MADISHLRQQIVRLRTERNALEDQELRSRAMVRGSLIELMRKCGKAECKCQRGELHGPNAYLSLPKPGKRSHLLPTPPEKVKRVFLFWMPLNIRHLEIMKELVNRIMLRKSTGEMGR